MTEGETERAGAMAVASMPEIATTWQSPGQMTSLDGAMNEGFDKVQLGRDSLELFASELSQVGTCVPARIDADPDRVEKGLAKLVLTIIELIRRLLEKQAIRRIEANSLTDDEIERIGLTFMKLEEKLTELKLLFGLEGEELNLNLGPLGDLM